MNHEVEWDNKSYLNSYNYRSNNRPIKYQMKFNLNADWNSNKEYSIKELECAIALANIN